MSSTPKGGRAGAALGRIEKQSGTYVLVMEAEGAGSYRVGRLGRLAVQHGVYLYVGSALGSGGVKARAARHLRREKKRHWHIDFLLPHLRLQAFLVAYSRRRLEHAWASALSRLPEAEIPMPGFGASDCRCASHLLFFPGWPDRAQFRKALEGASPRSQMVDAIGLD